MMKEIKEIFETQVAPPFNFDNYPNYSLLLNEDLNGFIGSAMENLVPRCLKVISDDGGTQTVCNFSVVDIYDGSQYLFIFVFSWIKDGKLCTYKNDLITEY